MTITPSEVKALEFDFGGEDGFHFDLGSFPGRGEQGLQGEKGDKGDTGAQGLQGEKGDKGDTGAQGLQGEKGDKGDTGATGAQGLQGKDATENDLSIRTVEGNIARDGFCVDGCQDTEKSVASCNSDEVLNGGGVMNSAGHVLYSKLVGNSWEAKGVSQGGQNPSTTKAYAQCQKLVPES
jgi:hypothetical protein